MRTCPSAWIASLAILLAPVAFAEGSAGPGPSPDLVQKVSDVVKKTRDPFKRIVSVKPGDMHRSELEQFPVEQFKMTGVISGLDKLRAMLVAPNGKTYFVTEKMKIGVRKGVITKITNDAIIVREHIINPLGDDQPVDVRLSLSDEGDGNKTVSLGTR